MKTALVATAVCFGLLGASAEAQSPSRRARARSREGAFVAPRLPGANTSIAPVTPPTGGAIPRAVRSGNPLQLLNPLAPAEYGSGHDVVRHDDDDPYQRPRGIKLVTFQF